MAHGHDPEAIDDMALRDVELLDLFARSRGGLL